MAHPFAVASRMRHPPRRLPGAAGALLAAAAMLLQAAGAADVALRAIAVRSSQTWTFSPAFYFTCGRGNRTDLPFLKEPMHLYKPLGNETWQPVLRLDRHQCAQCAVRQRGWIEDPTLGSWTICSSNFTAAQGPLGELTLSTPNEVSLTITCPQCAPQEALVPPPAPGPAVTAPPLGTVILQGLGLLGAAIALSIVATIVVVMRLDSEHDMLTAPPEEKAKMVELQEERGPAGSDLGEDDLGEVLDEEMGEERFKGSVAGKPL